MVQIYDATNIDSLTWPANEEGAYAKKFLVPFIKHGSKHYIDNVDTQFLALKLGELVLPITVNETQYDNSFICSPFSHYVSYAFNIMDKTNTGWKRKSIHWFLSLFSKIMKKGELNKVVIVNNWLFTTNPHVVLDKEQITAITKSLVDRFPGYAILFRSVNARTWKDSFNFLKNQGYNFIASRYVWITDSFKDEVFRTRVYKSDLKLLRDSKYQIVDQKEILDSDISKIQELYNALYIKKYSQINPQYNANFFKLALEQELLQIKAIKTNENLEGVVGYSYRNGVMISSLFGYDPLSGENKGVYRLLSTILMQEAKKNGGYYNQSAGGSFYKKIRRAEGHMEYTAVYLKHLPLKRKVPWQILQVALNTVGARFMKKY